MVTHVVTCLIVAMAFSTMLSGHAAAGEWAEPVERTFKATVDKTVQKYVVMLPKEFNAKEQHHVMIVLHGHGSDRWQYVKQARSECKGARDVAARHSMIYVSPDYRAATSWMGPKAEADMVQLIGLLRKKYKVGKVLLAGASMGGASSLIFAALHPKLVDGVVSQNGTANMITYENFQQAISASYGGTKKEKPKEYRKRSPELMPKRFTMPLALCVGGNDTSVPPDSVRRLYDHLKKMKKKDVLMIDRPKGGHSSDYKDTVAAMEYVVKAMGIGTAEKAKDDAGKEEKDESKENDSPAKGDKKAPPKSDEKPSKKNS